MFEPHLVSFASNILVNEDNFLHHFCVATVGAGSRNLSRQLFRALTRISTIEVFFKSALIFRSVKLWLAKEKC